MIGGAILAVVLIAGASTLGVGAAKGNHSRHDYGRLLLAAAESHDRESYRWGHGHDPSKWHIGDGMDCSGLVFVSVYEATHGKVVESRETVASILGDGHWKQIPMSKASPGDILLLLTHNNETDHVVFVVKNYHNGFFEDFAAWASVTQNGPVPQPDQVAYHKREPGSWYTSAARFVG